MGSTINNNLANSGYYQLSNLTGGQSGGTNAGNAAPNSTQSLVQALDGNNTGTNGSNDAYVLNLSPAAQQYLDGINSGSTPNLGSYLNGTGSASGSANPSSGPDNFLLSPQQQTAIANILTQFDTAPYTQETFDQIQNALNSAGLGTNTLSMKDQAQSFDPTMLLVNDLNGGPSEGVSGMTSAADEQTKSSNYMQSIISQWQALSANANKSSTSSSSQSTDTQTANAVSAVSSGSGT